MDLIEYAQRVLGQQRPMRDHQQIARDIHEAAARLSVQTRSWAIAPPSAIAIQEASNGVEGLRRSLTEISAATK